VKEGPPKVAEDAARAAKTVDTFLAGGEKIVPMVSRNYYNFSSEMVDIGMPIAIIPH